MDMCPTSKSCKACGLLPEYIELKDKEQHLSQIIQANAIPTFVIDQNHTITHWNSSCERLTGMPAEKMLGTQRQWQAFYDEKRPVLADLVLNGSSIGDARAYYGDQVKKTDFVDGGYEFLRLFEKFGENGKWLFITASPLKRPDGTVTGAIETLQDFSEEVRARNALSESEHRYRLLTENVADGVAIVQNGKAVFLNDELVRIMGHTRESFLELKARDLVRDDFREHFDEVVESLYKGIKIEQFTAPYLRGDGATIWVESRHNKIEWMGQPAILVTVRDVTENHIREASLQKESNLLKTENTKLRSTIKDRFRLGNIIGKSPAMQEIYELILKAAKSDANVIITGESGTGKELVARAIHEMSERSQMNLVPVNCGAIPDKLLESEFFGYKKGAFSGAVINKHGYLDLADNGSLFLDEVGELDPVMQVKLLRALDTGGYYPIGSSFMKHSDFRIIAATNRDLKHLVHNGDMREDFFFRLHVIPITMPPLRERKEDIPLLIDHFLSLSNCRKNITTIPGKILDKMYHYHWPGNIRELQNLLRRFVDVGEIDFMASEPAPCEKCASSPGALPGRVNGETLNNTIEMVEKEMVANALTQANWNRTKASKLLGISRRSLFRKMENHQLVTSTN